MLGKMFLGLVAGFMALISVQVAAPSAEANAGYTATASQYCTAFGIDVKLDWKGQNIYGGNQIIDVSLGNTWAPGTFKTYGPLSGSTSATIIQALQPGVTYYLRIAQQQSNGSWWGDEGMSFSTVPACNYDGSNRQPYLPSPGSQLIYPFQRAAIALIYAPGIVQVAAYPHVASSYLGGGSFYDIGNGGIGSGCNPSYPNNCFTFDVDCAGGPGNGPFVTGPILVVGSDPYGLDGDGDGIGCE